MSDDNQPEIVKSQADIDQAWRSIEPALPAILQIGESGPATMEEMELALICVRLVGWEISLRVVQREQYLRCVVLSNSTGSLPNEVAVRITTLQGHQSFYLPSDKVILDGVDAPTGKIEIKAVAVRQGVFAVQLPTIHKNSIQVSESEISL